MSLYAEQRAYLERGTEEARKKREMIESKPVTYAGVSFRSTLEAHWAYTLDHYGIKWDYEPDKDEGGVMLPSGRRYLPDFRLPEIGTVLEAKGAHMQRLDKTREHAREVHPAVITLVGYAPMWRKVTDWASQVSMQWGEALGYPSVFTQCTECGAWQWCRPRFSMRCRKCNAVYSGHFAGCGEMPFMTVPRDPEFNLSLLFGGALCPGSALTTASTVTLRRFQRRFQQGACGRQPDPGPVRT